MTSMFRRKIFAKRNESHRMYLLKLYWHGWKDYVYGVLSGVTLAVAFYFSI